MREKTSKKENKGFSLVELIVVIAIMVVLVAVLAPTFIKYVESSRRSTDIQNASLIADAVWADINEGEITGSGDVDANVGINTPSTLKTAPVTKGNAYAVGANFRYHYDKANEKVSVYIDGTDYNTKDLTDEDVAKAYKDASAGEWKSK